MSHKILVIDDEPDVLILMEARLKAAGFEVITALGPKEGLIRIKEHSPELIILDVLMPQMTGYDLVRELKSFPENLRKIPIIVTSGRRGMKDFFNPWEIHCFIQKPFEAEVLLAQVRSALKIGEGAPQNPVPGAPSAAPEVSAPRSKGSVVLISGIDDYLMGKMQDFLKQQGHTIELSGQEDDTLEQALKLKPKLILGQYVENPLTFDLRKIQKKLKENPETAALRFLVFCPSQIGVDALKMLDKTDVLLYSKSDELLTKLSDHLKQKPL